MIYGSVCSGIEAASQAWHPLGWSPAFFAEVDKFPSAVLAHHYGSNMPGEPYAGINGVPNYGDMSKFKEWPDHANLDVLVGGTPCQSFSVAGLRKGLDDPRGNLALVYLALADRYRPDWLVWENVPGVLSSNGGRDFGAFLGGLVKLGYGFCYRVLDAQYIRVDGYARAVPQRRRRVFVVGYLGDWRRAAAVLFEPESLRGDPPPRREAGERVAPTISARTKGGGGLGTDFDCDGGLIANGCGAWETGDTTDALTTGTDPNSHVLAFSCKDYGNDAADNVSPTLRSMGADKSHANAGGQLAVAIQERAVSENLENGPGGKGYQEGITYTLEARNKVQSVAYDLRGRDGGAQFEGPHETANIRAASGGSLKSYVQEAMAVRRLTPRECERLQGFPDDYTLIPSKTRRRLEADELRYLRSRSHEQLAHIYGVDPETFTGVSDDELCRLATDGPRYKALGNSMAINCMRWIGRRIEMMERIIGEID